MRHPIEECAAEINNAIDGTIYAEQAGERHNQKDHIRAVRRHLLKAGSALSRVRDTPSLLADRGNDNLANAELVINGITKEVFERQDRWFADDLWREFVDAKSVVLAALRATAIAPLYVPQFAPSVERTDAESALIQTAIESSAVMSHTGSDSEQLFQAALALEKAVANYKAAVR